MSINGNPAPTIDIPATAPESKGGDFGRVVQSEWTKFRSVRSSFWTLVVAIAVTIGAGVGFLPTIIDQYSGQPDHAADSAVQEGWWFEGMHVSLLAMMILGVLVASAEYGTW